MQQTAPDPAQIQRAVATMLPLLGVFFVVVWAIIIIPFWQIFKKAGLGGPLSLLMLIPLVNLVMLYVLAFSRWKVVPAPEYGGLPPAGYAPPGYVPAGYVAPATGGYEPPLGPPPSV